MDEESWRRLLDKIRENNVVPIIGSRVLVDADGHTSLHARVAQRVIRVMKARGIEVQEGSLPPFREINEAISRLKKSVPLQDLYDHVNDALREVTTAADFVTPTAIRQLAEIADFRLMVTLTCDDLLSRCLRQRCAVNEIIHSPNQPTSERKDLPDEWQERPGEVQLLYLFGKAKSAPFFAIHDEDVLEYAHNVMAQRSHMPARFLDELQQRNLLLIGCNFPDWLSRFFLRATNRGRLTESINRSWLIEPLQPEESLTCFLNSYSKGVELLSDTPPIDFVNELHRRWLAQLRPNDEAGSENGDARMPRRAMFFISYSRATDVPRARKLYSSLLEQGVSANELWFDQKTIEPGHDFAARILDGIHDCRYFLPLLSSAANGREEAFVFSEWREANLRNARINREFIVPLVVDDEYSPESYTAQPVRDWKGLDFGHAPGGVPDGRLRNKLPNLVREARRGA
jgi:hypothetical protein